MAWDAEYSRSRVEPSLWPTTALPVPQRFPAPAPSSPPTPKSGSNAAYVSNPSLSLPVPSCLAALTFFIATASMNGMALSCGAVDPPTALYAGRSVPPQQAAGPYTPSHAPCGDRGDLWPSHPISSSSTHGTGSPNPPNSSFDTPISPGTTEIETASSLSTPSVLSSLHSACENPVNYSKLWQQLRSSILSAREPLGAGAHAPWPDLQAHCR